MHCSSTISIDGCTFYGNESPTGTLGIGTPDASMTLERTIVAFSTQGAAAMGLPNFTLTCCDVFGNAGGDYVGCIASEAGTSGNFSLDPRFHDEAAGDLRLHCSSPCLSAPSCGLVGALGLNPALGVSLSALIRGRDVIIAGLYGGLAVLDGMSGKVMWTVSQGIFSPATV